ncbi:putative Transposon TX1 [Sesbania bispinosa]|nr:putative Transposon TX1 [Sesbania bispinosa]
MPRIDSFALSPSRTDRDGPEPNPEVQGNNIQHFQEPPNDPGQDDLFGPWMIVKKQQRRRQSRVVGEDSQGQQLKMGKGSRFDILNEEGPISSNFPVAESFKVDPVVTPPIPKVDSNLAKPTFHKVRNTTGGKNPQSGTHKKKDPRRGGKGQGPLGGLVDKAEEREIFAMMHQFQKEGKDSFQSSKAIMQYDTVLLDSETLNFIECRHRKLGVRPPPRSLLISVLMRCVSSHVCIMVVKVRILKLCK